jgi:tRNA(fMet)-specific endonuclease VapC
MPRPRAKSVKKRAAVKPLKRKLRARVRGSSLELLDPKPAALRDGDEVTVTLSQKRKPNLAALRRAAGSWKGHVDADALIENIYRDRLIQSRPVPHFESVRFLIDSDWTIHFLNGRRDVVARVEELFVQGVALSFVSLAEVYEGVLYSRDPEADEAGLRSFLAAVTLMDIDEQVARIFGHERGRLRQLRKTIGDCDVLIATAALRYDLTLLTNNRRHFELVENLRIVSI